MARRNTARDINILVLGLTPQQRENFWSKVHKSDDPNGCWIWMASTQSGGYGQFAINTRPELSHRVAYILLRGPVSFDLELDHLCRNRQCCNPWHLEEVTQEENQHRGNCPIGKHRDKTHCPQGHPYDRLYKGRKGDFRYCTKCHAEANRRTRANAKLRRLKQAAGEGQG